MSVYELPAISKQQNVSTLCYKNRSKIFKTITYRKIMNYIVNNEKLIIQYISGMVLGLINLLYQTKGIKGKWGDLKVSGKIDNFEIKNKI
jgi:hypothetical protein